MVIKVFGLIFMIVFSSSRTSEVALISSISGLLNNIYVFKSFFLSLPHLVANEVKNVDELGRNIMCDRTLLSLLVFHSYWIIWRSEQPDFNYCDWVILRTFNLFHSRNDVFLSFISILVPDIDFFSHCWNSHCYLIIKIVWVKFIGTTLGVNFLQFCHIH